MNDLPVDKYDLLELCKQQGWVVGKTNRGHWKCCPPAGRIIITSGTDSDHRGVLNFRADLRRHGLKSSAEMKLSLLPTIPAPTTIPLRIEPAIEEIPMPKVRPEPGSVRRDIIKAMYKADSAGKGMHVSELINFVQVYRPGMLKSNLNVNLCDGAKWGWCMKIGKGAYVLTEKGRTEYHQAQGNGSGAVISPAPPVTAAPPPETSNKPLPATRILTTTSRTGDRAVDADLKILDRVMDAINEFDLMHKRGMEKLMSAVAGLDQVIRGNLEKTQKFSQLKSLLDQVNR